MNFRFISVANYDIYCLGDSEFNFSVSVKICGLSLLIKLMNISD